MLEIDPLYGLLSVVHEVGFQALQPAKQTPLVTICELDLCCLLQKIFPSTRR